MNMETIANAMAEYGPEILLIVAAVALVLIVWQREKIKAMVGQDVLDEVQEHLEDFLEGELTGEKYDERREKIYGFYDSLPVRLKALLSRATYEKLVDKALGAILDLLKDKDEKKSVKKEKK